MNRKRGFTLIELLVVIAIIAILAVQLAGGVYVPLDPDSPEDRLAAILDAVEKRRGLARALGFRGRRRFSGRGTGRRDHHGRRECGRKKRWVAKRKGTE